MADRRTSLGEALRTPYEENERLRAKLHEDDDSVAVQAAKEVDSERREIDEVNEQMRNRQCYFHEKAQMYREAADFYQRMSEDLAQLLDNSYVHGEEMKR